MTRDGNVLRNTAFSLIATYVEFFLGLVISIVIARSLGPHIFGVYTYLVWVSATLMIFINGGLPSALTKFSAELRTSNPSTLAPFTVYMQKLHTRRLLVVASLCVIAIAVAGEHIGSVETKQLLWFAAAVALIKATYMFYVALAKGHEDFRGLAIVIGVVAPINVSMVLALSVWWPRIELFLLTLFVVSMLYFIAIRVVLRKQLYLRPQTYINADFTIRVNSYLRVIAINIVLSYIVYRQSEVFFLNRYSTPENVALFNVAFTLATSAAALAPGVYSALLLPLMARKIKEGMDAAAAQFIESTRYLLMLSAPIIAIGIIFSSEIIELLYGRNFAASTTPFMVCLVISALQIVAQASSSYQLSADKQFTLLKMLACGAAINITLAYFLVREYALFGAVAANALSGLFMSIGLMTLTKVELRASMPLSNYVRIVAAAAAAALPIWLSKGYLHPALELLLGGVLFVTLYVGGMIVLGVLSADEKEYIKGLRVRFARKGNVV